MEEKWIISNEYMFKIITEFIKKGHPISSHSTNKSEICSKDKKFPFECNHAYSLLEAQNIKIDKRVIKLFNPNNYNIYIEKGELKNIHNDLGEADKKSLKMYP